MNIFILNEDPEIAAQEQCDKHVVKMILETAQMLCSAYPNGDAPYKRTHFNHPCTIWARQSFNNYKWLILHGKALCKEYTKRYNKVHKSQKIIEWCDLNKVLLDFPKQGITPFIQAMPDEYKDESAVKAYRKYYCVEKKAFAKWDKTDKPKWFKPCS